ncbi:MAG: tetratricopeptide repeat protein [Planctomycetes bacterium]|nr:tetratricopeptide repeat protein [Planctomycetota bacterium]
MTTVARGQLAARSRPADGLALVARACELDPLWVEAHLALGELLTRDLPPALRDGARAEAACTRALELTDDAALAARARVVRAEARLLRAGAAGAGPPAEEAARARCGGRAALPPAEAEPVLRPLAAVRRRLGDEAGATAALARAEQARAARDELVSAWLADAQRLRERQDYSGAIALLDRALAVDPRSGDAYYERGTCYLKVGNFVPGILDFSRAVELDPRRADPVHRRLGLVARVTNVDRVLAEMDRLVADHPDTSYVLFLRGMFRLSKCEQERFAAEDVDLGLADLDRCLELNPEHVTALVFRAALRLRGAGLLPAGAPGREERYAAAMTDLGLALEKDPGSGVSHYFQGLCWSLRADEPGLDDAGRADRLGRAVVALRAAVATGYQVGERLAADRGFDALRQDPAYGELLKPR